MKTIILGTILFASVISFGLQAVEVESASYDQKNDEAAVTLSYMTRGGHLGEREFELKISDMCSKSYPAKCDATVFEHISPSYNPYIDIEPLGGYVNQKIVKTVRFSLNDFTNRPALLTIYGENGGEADIMVSTHLAYKPLDVSVAKSMESITISFTTKLTHNSMCHLSVDSLELSQVTTIKENEEEGRVGVINLTTSLDEEGICMDSFGPHSGSITFKLGHDLPNLKYGVHRLVIDGVSYNDILNIF